MVKLLNNNASKHLVKNDFVKNWQGSVMPKSRKNMEVGTARGKLFWKISSTAKTWLFLDTRLQQR